MFRNTSMEKSTLLIDLNGYWQTTHRRSMNSWMNGGEEEKIPPPLSFYLMGRPPLGAESLGLRADAMAVIKYILGVEISYPPLD
jgi:hypothetical protein